VSKASNARFSKDKQLRCLSFLGLRPRSTQPGSPRRSKAKSWGGAGVPKSERSEGLGWNWRVESYGFHEVPDQSPLRGFFNILSLEEATEHSEGCEPLVRRCALIVKPREGRHNGSSLECFSGNALAWANCVAHKGLIRWVVSQTRGSASLHTLAMFCRPPGLIGGLISGRTAVRPYSG